MPLMQIIIRWEKGILLLLASSSFVAKKIDVFSVVSVFITKALWGALCCGGWCA